MSTANSLWNIRFAGLATAAELLARGYTRGQIRALVARAELVRVDHGVYAVAQEADRLTGESPVGRVVLLAAAALITAPSGSVLSHHTAAQLQGLSLLGAAPQRLDLTHPPGAATRSGKRGVLMHCAVLPAAHIWGWHGLPATIVPRTVTDLARNSSFREGVVVADSALRLKLTSKKELRAVLADCPRTPGLRRAAEVVEFADGLAESVLESIARVAFRDCGLPRPVLQVRIGTEQFIGRVDFLWEQYRTIAEVDGMIKYVDPARARDQLRRDKRLREAGYEVVHFDWREVTTEPALVARSIRAAFRRGRRLVPATARG